jgi:UDP-GlcNAc:undecaprenyl-phosphate GlcNAc-1-phosphate transferase
LRALVQLAASFLLLIESALPAGFFLWLGTIVVLIGMINACNFMDGINGMTAFYSATVMAGLFIVNREIHAFDELLLVCVALSNLVFTFFNARRNARCFAGDVGSISMAYILLFFTINCIVLSANPIFLLFFILYITDVAVTILQRIYKSEMIFEAHRMHLFQCLANEKKMPQLIISGIYAIIQMIITAGVLLVWKKEPSTQLIYAAFVVIAVLLLYLFVKFRLLNNTGKKKLFLQQ